MDEIKVGILDGVRDEIMGEYEKLIESIKQDKARNKSAFTRIKNKLLQLLDEDGQTETFETTPEEVKLESLDGNVKTKLSAFTAERDTGDMEVISWKKHAARWSHLKRIQFPNLGIRPIVDLLIGIDYAELHFSCKDIRGNLGEPVARLTPLGRSCTGPVSGLKHGSFQTRFAHTYFVRENTDRGEISRLLRGFWEIES